MKRTLLTLAYVAIFLAVYHHESKVDGSAPLFTAVFVAVVMGGTGVALTKEIER